MKKAHDRNASRLRAVIALLCVLPLLILVPGVDAAAGDDVEKDLQDSLIRSRAIVKNILKKQEAGASVRSGVEQLKSIAGNVRADDLLLSERFRIREEKAKALGSKALERHQAMAEGFRKALTEYLSLIDSLPPNSQESGVRSQENIEKLKTLLDGIIPEKKLPIHGSLPYRHLNYPPSQPTTAPSITPAYLGGNKTVSPDDTAATDEAPVSAEISSLAQSLNWNPVSIYEYVKNNVETEWYRGCMKGAEETLHQKSGNDCDQAALLTALLRASGFPTRYMRGVIRFFPDIERAKNLTGIDDPAKIAEFFQKSGIPFTPIIAGGTISNFKIEHVWVESQIPYANYRGAVIDEHGKAWLGLDTSIKAKGYTYNNTPDFYQQSAIGDQLSAIRDEYLSTAATNSTPLEYFKTRLSAIGGQQNPPLTAESYKLTRSLVPEVLSILPASMQFVQVKITNEYESIPDELIHKVRFRASRQNTVDSTQGDLFDITIPLYKLSNQQVAITYEAETVEDQNIIDAWGGLDNTPAYLVRLRPVLTVNKERMIVAQDGLSMGSDYILTIELFSPRGTEKITNSLVVGNLVVVGVTPQKAVAAQQDANAQKDAERLLYEEAINYSDRWNKAEDELASLFHMTIARPIPSVVLIGGVIDVSYLLDMPHGFTWKGVYVDANLRAIETGAGSQITDDGQKLFMQLSSLQGSILENRIFEDDFKVDSVSTAKLFQVVNQGTAGGQGPLTIDRTNVDAVLPTLPFDDNVREDIANSVNQNLVVRIPQAISHEPFAVSYNDWTGVGYIKEDPATGESGFMLSGMIAGGMTAWSVEKWNAVLEGTLSSPYSEPANYDPSSAHYIEKVSATDMQEGTVGTKLPRPLQVKVTDAKHKRVPNVQVTFTIKAGGGKFDNGKESIDATTNDEGVASAVLMLGKFTKDNPTMVWEENAANSTQAGENIVDAALSSGAGLVAPFTELGMPDSPSAMNPLDCCAGRVFTMLNFAGYVGVSVNDQYGNPISNIAVTFSVGQPTSTDCNDPSNAAKKTYLVPQDEACLLTAPIWGACGNTDMQTLDTRTSRQGAVAQVIMGGLANTVYPITAACVDARCVPTAQESFTRSFKRQVMAIGNCSGNQPAEYTFSVARAVVTDAQGHTLDAGRSGTTLPLAGRLVLVEEGMVMSRVTTNLASCSITCDKMVGNRQYSVNTSDAEFGTALVELYNGTGNSYKGKRSMDNSGLYTWDYTLLPGPNYIMMSGEATVQRMATKLECPNTCTTSKTDFHIGTNVVNMVVYGVDIRTDPVPVIVVDQNGYAAQDYEISYTIAPAEYQAGTAYVMIYKNSDIIAAIPTEKQGTGFATISRGFHFDTNSTYYAQVVLNYGGGAEIRGDKVQLFVLASSTLGRSFGLERAYHLSRFDDPVPGILAAASTDSFEAFTFTLQSQSDVSVKILDSNGNVKGTLVPTTTLAPGDHKFLVDYFMAQQAGFDPVLSPNFFVLLEMTAQGAVTAQPALYPGKLYQRSDGKMLGQTLVHDVLIQDGSLNLSRQDLALKGRGPQLAFSRSYNNQPSPKGFKPLGEGWSHSLDMRMRFFNPDASAVEPLWATSHRGMFYTASDEPPSLGPWSVLQVNGTVFKKNNNVWYAERGHHGSLIETSTGYIYTAKDGTKYTYPYPAGIESQVRKIEDRNGNAMTFAYDAYNRLQTVTDAVGRTLTLRYAQLPNTIGLDNTRLTKVTGPDNIELDFAYDGNGYLASAQRADRFEQYAYQPEPGSPGDHNLIKTTDANGHSYSYTYYLPNDIAPSVALLAYLKVLKSTDVVKTVTYPDNKSAQFQYNVQTGNQRIVTDLRGNNSVYTLNFFGNPMKIDEPLGKTTLMTWSIDQGLPDNVMTSKTDALGNKTTYQYDAKGNISLETDPYGNAITTVWNQIYSLPLSRTDRNNVTQTWQYDNQGNLLAHTDGDGKQASYAYYTTGELKTATDPRGYAISYTYDQYGNPSTITGPEGSVTTYEYDIRGRRASIKDPNGFTTTYTYDDLDHPTRINHPAISAYNLPSGSSTSETFSYDPLGNLLSETNRNGLTLTYAYTARNQVASVNRSTGGTKTYTYDANGNLLTETDWKGARFSHFYNPLNQRFETTNRLNNTMLVGYDLVGNLTAVSDYEGNLTTYGYDKLYRQTDVWQPALPGLQAGHIVKTYYNEADAKTNLKTETDQEGNATVHTYNGRYQPVTRANALGDVYTWTYDDDGNLASETDEEGNTTSYDYDRQNRRIAIHKTLANRDIKTAYQYDPAGNRTHVIDPLGHDTQTQYDEWNRPWQVKDADNFTTTTWYDGEGNPVNKIDGIGNSRTWQRDSQGRVQATTDALGNATTFAYDENDNVLATTDALGTITQNAYDAEDKLTTTTEAAGTQDHRTKTVLSRDKMGNPLQAQDWNGNVTTTSYNALYLPAQVCDPTGNCTSTTYYRTGKVNTVTNRRGYATSHMYDSLNREIKVTDPKNQTIQTTYDKVGNVKTVTDKRGIVKTNTYDELYRLAKTERAGITLVTNEYDDAGNKIAATDANGNRTTYAYNNRNLLKTTTYSDNSTQSRTYDGVSNVLTVTDEEGKVTTYTYDKENRQTSVIFAGEKTQKDYDAVGNNISITKPLGNKRAITYDRIKRLSTVTDDPDGLMLTTTYQYDANGNLLHQYDARGNHVEYTYDALNRKTKHNQHKQTGDLITSYTSYDEEGNLTGMTDAKNQSFVYAYDELNRKTDDTYPTDGLTPYLTIATAHTNYDPNNNVIGIIETKKVADGSTVTDTTINIYDDFDRLATTTERGVAITYAYDNNGNRTLVSSPSGTTTYTFDSRNRLGTASDGAATTSFTYYPDGKKNTVVYPNGTDVKYTYWPTNRVKTVLNEKTSDGTVISSYAYGYDANGNRTGQTEVQNGTTETTAYTYDSLDRMKTFTVTGTTTTLTEYTFEGYNRKTEKVTQNGTVTANKTYSYDETDWLTSVTDNADPQNVRTVNYAYDRNGNTMLRTDSISSAQNRNFVYDALNRLVRTTDSNNTVLGLYDYNSGNLRIRHRNSDRGDVDYFYDGRSVIDEYDASSGSPLAHYRYADRLISLSSVAGIQYYHHDGLGSTVNLTDTAGATQVSYQLDPWGHIRSQSGYSINRHIFTGKEHDQNTGLVYFGERYYDADTARFITQDTYLGERNTPPSLHRYLYAYSNPTVYVDENGHSVTAAGAIVGFFWGTEQMFQGMYDDLSEKKYRSTIEYLGIIGQNVVAGTEIGASIDIAAMSGGWAAPASLAIGGAGFETITTNGRAVGSATELLQRQAGGAAKGLLLGGALMKAAPYISRGISAIPGGQRLLQELETLGEAAVRGLSNVGETALADVSGNASAKAGQAVTQRATGEAASEVSPKLLVENMEGDPATTVAKVENVTSARTESAASKIAVEPYQLRQNYHYRDANVVNRELGGEPQYKTGTLAVEFQTGTEEHYVRVYTKGFNRPQGGWMMRAEDIAGLTPEQIQQKYALPKVPTHVVDAEVPSHFRLRIGEAGPNAFARGGGGGIQAEALDSRRLIKFSNERPLP